MSVDRTPIKIQRMFNNLANKYDFMNDVISLGLHRFIKKYAIKLLDISSGAKVLDCCTGTGDIPSYILKNNPKCSVVGVDFSENMLEIAREKVPNVEFVLGDCVDLPFSQEKFDFVTTTFGLRNISDRQKAVSEMYRVLKIGGKLLQLDFGKSKIPDFVFKSIVNLSSKLLTKSSDSYSYLLKSKDEFLTSSEIVELFEIAGFKLVKSKSLLFGVICLQIFEK